MHGNGAYTVVANDGVGSITSAPATLVIQSAVPITDGLVVYFNFDTNITAQAGTTNAGRDGDRIQWDAGIHDGPNRRARGLQQRRHFSVGWSSDWALSLGDIEWLYAGNWRLSVWVSLTNYLDGGLLGNKDWTSGSDVGWVFAPYNTTELNYEAPPGARQDLGAVNVIGGPWHHVACVFNRDANTVLVYVDGQQTSSAPLGLSGWESLTPTTFSPNATLVGSSGDEAYSGAGALDDLGGLGSAR